MLLALLFGISAVGAFLQRTFITFHPMIVAGAGGSESMGAVSISVYLGATGLGTLFGGWLTDRVRRGTLLLVLTFLAVPAHALALALAPGSAGALAAAAAAGFLSMAILPPIVVTAQESLPSGAGTTSGIVMGLAWGAGSLAVLLAGLGGDVAGPRAAALWATPIGLLACVLAVQKPIRRMGTSAHRAG
jgi:FSR family fosmidomycin resistance protein-like MFS transporter